MRGTPREVFAKHGLRCTLQRAAVYDALCAARRHLTAEELFHAVRSADSAISLATVYNALDAFTRVGIARRLSTPHAVAGGATAFRYDADTHNHAHVVTSAGDVIDLPEDLSSEILAYIPESAIRRVEQQTGRRLSRVSIEFIEQPPESADA